MSTVVRKPYERITVGGVTLTQVISWRASNGADQRFATAEIVLPTRPDGLIENQEVLIIGGANRASATTRFKGKLLDFKRSLAPLRTTLICRGKLFAAMDNCNNPGGTDLSNAGTGQTDQAMVEQILDAVGITDRSIAGSSTVLGTIAGPNAFTWRENQSGLSFIEQLDEATRYSTFDTPSGTVTRALLNPLPRTSAAFTFTEGVDIYRADLEEDVFTTQNRVTVNGYSDGNGGAFTWTVEREDTYVDTPDGFRTFVLSNPMIERQASDDVGDGLACEDVAIAVIQEVDVVLQHVAFDTPRDDNVGIGTIIAVNAPNRLGSDGDTFWVQNVTTQRSERGGFSQHFICLGGKGSTSPITSPPIPNFEIRVVEKDPIVTGFIWVVYCEDTSTAQTGTIVGWDWESDGTPASGSDSTYTVFYDHDPTGETISLTVTDSNGDTASISKVVGDTIGVDGQVIRKLYPANKYAEDWDGVTWRLFTDINAIDVFSAGNGPIWDAGKDAIASSTDLITTPTTTTPFGSGEQVSSEWIETDVDDSTILAGSNLGRVAVSFDAGLSWTVLSTVPDSEAILRVAIDGANPSQYFALTADHLYVSYLAGAPGSWGTLQTAAMGEAFVDLSLSFARSMIAIDGGRLMIEMTSGTTQTFPGSPTKIAAVTADIRKDRFYAVDNDGHTYFTTTEGGTAFSAGADLPMGSDVHERFIQRDGDIRDLIYLALGLNGLWKSLDGFATDGGYQQVRNPGTGNCPADADYRQVGVDGRLTSITETAPAILYLGTSDGLYRRDAPFVYTQTGLTTGSVHNIATARGAPDIIYAIVDVGGGTWQLQKSTDGSVSWSDISSTLPSGVDLSAGPSDISCPDGDGSSIYLIHDDPSTYANRGLWLSTDGGSSWTIQDVPSIHPPDPPGDSAYQVDVTDHDPSYIMDHGVPLYKPFNPLAGSNSSNFTPQTNFFLRSIRGSTTTAVGGQSIFENAVLFKTSSSFGYLFYPPITPTPLNLIDILSSGSETQFIALITKNSSPQAAYIYQVNVTGTLVNIPGNNGHAPAQALLRKTISGTSTLGFVYALSYDPNATKNWFCVWEAAEVQVSKDGGVSWNQEDTGIVATFYCSKVAAP